MRSLMWRRPTPRPQPEAGGRYNRPDVGVVPGYVDNGAVLFLSEHAIDQAASALLWGDDSVGVGVGGSQAEPIAQLGGHFQLQTAAVMPTLLHRYSPACAVSFRSRSGGAGRIFGKAGGLPSVVAGKLYASFQLAAGFWA